MHALVTVVGVANLVAFVALGAIAVVQWRRRRDAAAGWVAAAFSALGVVVVLGRLVPAHPSGLAQVGLQRVEIVVLLLFPYLLFSFTTAFDAASRRLRTIVAAMTATLVVWTLVLPHFPEQGEPRPAGYWAYLVAFLVHWSALTLVVAVRLWRGGRGQPGVSKRRMQMLALASSAITLALFVLVTSSDAESPAAAVGGVLASLSALGFLLGLAPPQIVRMLWRHREQRRLQDAVLRLITLAESPEDVAGRVVEPMAAIVGARAVAVGDGDGRVVATYNLPQEACEALERGDAPPQTWANARVVEVPVDGASLTVWTSQYAPFFGDDELRLLQSLAAMTAIALDRVRLFEREHETRLALERANEVQKNFIALAAHELRTPVTTIHGFARTLNHLGDRLTEEQRVELRESLEQQTARMALLVEQLLDLSRLDADAVQIRPERFDVRDRVEEIVADAAVGRTRDVLVDVPEVDVTADPVAFDRIVSNLVTNAFRYGAPPVTVRAQRSDRHLRVWVEDCGEGVPDEFVPSLFERFSRARDVRDRSTGTGLGLAIARSYARAHAGDLLYENAEPHGARFLLVLPTEA